MIKYLSFGYLLLAFLSSHILKAMPLIDSNKDSVYLIILGIAQDGGYPQLGCNKSCCMAFKQGKETKKQVVSLGLTAGSRYWLFEATPDIGMQLDQMQKEIKSPKFQLPEGIFFFSRTYRPLYRSAVLRKRSIWRQKVPVFAMPRMEKFLNDNGPWSQLKFLNNIVIESIKNKTPVTLDAHVTVTPILVPHRDEYSETVGFLIHSAKKSVLFIPDIDKWEKWQESILAMIQSVDIALIDGTFFQNGELPDREMSEVPHPFVEESLKYFEKLSPKEKAKICFIHFNHTNPLIKKQSVQKDQLIKMGYRVAEEGMRITL